MSILGVKKIKKIDTTKIEKMEKDILKFKSKIITFNRKDRYLYNNANTLNVKVLNLENTIKGIKDKQIISISAVQKDEKDYYEFYGGSDKFIFPYTGKIISVSVFCEKRPGEEPEEGITTFSYFLDVLKNDEPLIGINVDFSVDSGYGNKDLSYYASYYKGDILRVKKNYDPYYCNVIISFIAELNI